MKMMNLITSTLVTALSISTHAGTSKVNVSEILKTESPLVSDKKEWNVENIKIVAACDNHESNGIQEVVLMNKNLPGKSTVIYDLNHGKNVRDKSATFPRLTHSNGDIVLNHKGTTIIVGYVASEDLDKACDKMDKSGAPVKTTGLINIRQTANVSMKIVELKGSSDKVKYGFEMRNRDARVAADLHSSNF